MNPKRIAVKFFTTDPTAGADLEPFIALFHRFIQQAAVEGLLLDVADYAHVPNGPGIVLIGHDVDYGIDSVGGRTGLLTIRKRADLPFEALLTDTLRKALGAAKAIEDDGSAKIEFALDRVEISVFDRLFAANDDAGFEAARPGIEAVVGRLFGKATLERVATGDARAPLGFEAIADPGQTLDAKSLLDRLGGPAAAATRPAGPMVPGQTKWDISAEQLKAMRDGNEDFVLVDVREQNELDICEIGGLLMPLGSLSQRMGELDQNAHIVVHCHVGGRSSMAVNALREAGFGNVWNLQGGIRAWIQRVDSSLTDY
jgi:rhodanese-related sulfurtransferase